MRLPSRGVVQPLNDRPDRVDEPSVSERANSIACDRKDRYFQLIENTTQNQHFLGAKVAWPFNDHSMFAWTKRWNKYMATYEK